MDQDLLWNNFLHSSVENQDLPNDSLSPNITNISCGDVAGQESGSFNIWDPVGPSSSVPLLQQGNHDELKLESSWTSSPIGTRAGGPRITGSRSEAVNTLSFENENTDLSRNHVNNGEALSQFLNLQGLRHNVGYNPEHVSMSRQVLESAHHPGVYNPGLVQHQHVSFTASSSRAIDFFSNNNGGKREVAQCSSHKRKNIEGMHGECSASGSSNNFNEGVNHAEEEINARISTITRVPASDPHPFGSVAGNDESFQRNTRMRINHADPANTSTPNLWPQENIITRHNLWSAHQLSSPDVPLNPSSELRLVGGNLGSRRQHYVHTTAGLFPDLYPIPQNEASTAEVGSSSGSPAIAVDGAAGVQNSSSVSNNIPEQIYVLPANTRRSVRDQTNWGLTNGSTVFSGNALPTSQVGTNLGIHQSQGANWLPHQHRRRRVSEAPRRSVSSHTETRGRSISLLPHHDHSSMVQDVGHHQSGAVSRGHQQTYIRSNMLHRQNDGALGIPLSMRTLVAAREARSRISEIRNVFDLIRRGDSLLLEDVLLFEQSVFPRGANLHDRHRDMRMDVDNMSYEELLALGERIGTVNTGLTEEKILSNLRQWKYVSIAAEPSEEEVEPCCICREDYLEGEELGRLDCGHDFHTACIKQWLLIKNLCPICKTTALST